VPVEKVSATFEEVAGLYQKQASLPGFRVGKAPRHLVAKAYDGRIQEETRKRLFDESYRQATQEQKLRVIVTVNVEEQSFGRGQPFSFTVTLEHTPEFEVPTYKGLKGRRELVATTDADVDRALNILRSQQARFNDVTREAVTGDAVVVNYTGTCEGKPITAFNETALGLTTKQGTWMMIGEGQFIPGFTEQLVGAKAGDKRTVTVTFPADFVISEVAGKEGAFEVEITAIKERILPEVNDEFAKGFGAENTAQLLEGIRRDLQNELDFRVKRAVRDQLLKQLLDQVSFELPESVVASETRNLIYNIVNENQRRGVAKEIIEGKKDEIFQNANTSAKDRVKAAFILNQIAAAEKISVDQKELTQRVLQLAQQNNVKPEQMVKTLQERNSFPELQQDILTGKVLDWLELHGQIEDVVAGIPTPATPAA
jgi:trigger factor